MWEIWAMGNQQSSFRRFLKNQKMEKKWKEKHKSNKSKLHQQRLKEYDEIWRRCQGKEEKRIIDRCKDTTTKPDRKSARTSTPHGATSHIHIASRDTATNHNGIHARTQSRSDFVDNWVKTNTATKSTRSTPRTNKEIIVESQVEDCRENSFALLLAQRHLVKIMHENFTLNPYMDEARAGGRGTYNYRRRTPKGASGYCAMLKCHNSQL